ncbi:MAG: GNAT family N-acetyltransferase [Candidatus Woesearchaeota archaeon]
MYHSLLIEAIAVRRDRQYSGLGRMLVEYARDFARLQGKSRLLVYTFYEYKTGNFYKKCGFEIGLEVKDSFCKFYMPL